MRENSGIEMAWITVNDSHIDWSPLLCCCQTASTIFMLTPGFNDKDLKMSAQNKTFSLFTDHLLVRLYHEERMQCCSNAATRKQASCQDLVRKKITPVVASFSWQTTSTHQWLIRIPNQYGIIWLPDYLVALPRLHRPTLPLPGKNPCTRMQSASRPTIISIGIVCIIAS